MKTVNVTLTEKELSFILACIEEIKSSYEEEDTIFIFEDNYISSEYNPLIERLEKLEEDLIED